MRRSNRTPTPSPVLLAVRKLVADHAGVTALVAEQARLLADIQHELDIAIGRTKRGQRRTAVPPVAKTTRPTAARKPRRPITDPVVLEKRRNALAAARAALAERRAAAAQA